MVREGERPPRQGGARHQGVRPDGRLAQRGPPVGAAHQTCLRGLSARLQTDRIDLYQMHHIDRDAWWDEIWQAMEQLVQEGKIIYVGSANFAGWHIARANEIARRAPLPRPRVGAEPVQPERAARRARGAPGGASEYGMGFIPWSPLSGGLLAGALGKVAEGRRNDEYMRGEIEQHRSSWSATRSCAPSSGNVRPTWRSRGCWPTPSSPRPSSDPERSSSSTASMRALKIELDARNDERAGRDLPGPRGQRRPRPTPGSGAAQPRAPRARSTARAAVMTSRE